MNAEQDRLHKDPAAPQGLPTRKAIADASKKAAKAGDGAAKRANRLRDLVGIVNLTRKTKIIAEVWRRKMPMSHGKWGISMVMPLA